MFPRLAASQSSQQIFLHQLKQDLEADPLLRRMRWMETDVRRRIDNDLESLRQSRKRFPALAKSTDAVQRSPKPLKRGRKGAKELYVFRKTHGDLSDKELQRKWETLEKEFRR